MTKAKDIYVGGVGYEASKRISNQIQKDFML